MRASISGVGNQGIINKAKWRTHNRYKIIIGRRLRARTEQRREVKTKIACGIRNRFLELGKAQSEQITEMEDGRVYHAKQGISAIEILFMQQPRRVVLKMWKKGFVFLIHGC